MTGVGFIIDALRAVKKSVDRNTEVVIELQSEQGVTNELLRDIRDRLTEPVLRDTHR